MTDTPPDTQHRKKPKQHDEKRTAFDLALIQAAMRGYSVSVALACDVEIPSLGNISNFVGTVESVDRYFVKFVVPTTDDGDSDSISPWVAKNIMGAVVVHTEVKK